MLAKGIKRLTLSKLDFKAARRILLTILIMNMVSVIRYSFLTSHAYLLPIKITYTLCPGIYPLIES